MGLSFEGMECIETFPVEAQPCRRRRTNTQSRHECPRRFPSHKGHSCSDRRRSDRSLGHTHHTHCCQALTVFPLHRACNCSKDRWKKCLGSNDHKKFLRALVEHSRSYNSHTSSAPQTGHTFQERRHCIDKNPLTRQSGPLHTACTSTGQQRR